MNEKIRELAQQSELWDRLDPRSLGIPGGSTESRWGEELQEFAELIVRECAKLNRTQSYELSGVVVDTEDGHGFDSVCLNTVKRVEQYLAGNDLLKHFGVEE